MNKPTTIQQPERDYETYIGEQFAGLVDVLRRQGIVSPKEKRFRFEINPSVDSGIGPHLDAHAYVERNNKYESLGGATILTNILKINTAERARYIQTLVAAGGSLRVLCDDEEYLVVLRREITTSDSRGLGKALGIK